MAGAVAPRIRPRHCRATLHGAVGPYRGPRRGLVFPSLPQCPSLRCGLSHAPAAARLAASPPPAASAAAGRRWPFPSPPLPPHSPPRSPSLPSTAGPLSSALPHSLAGGARRRPTIAAGGPLSPSPLSPEPPPSSSLSSPEPSGIGWPLPPAAPSSPWGQPHLPLLVVKVIPFSTKAGEKLGGDRKGENGDRGREGDNGNRGSGQGEWGGRQRMRREGGGKRQ